MNRRASVRLSLRMPIIYSEESESDPVPVKQKNRRSRSKFRHSFVTPRESDIQVTTVEKECQKSPIVIVSKNSNDDELDLKPGERNKNRMSSIKVSPTELTISEESDIQPEIKQRRLSLRLAMKRPLHANEDPQPVKIKSRRSSQLKIPKSTFATKENDIEATFVEGSQKTPLVVDFENLNVADPNLDVESSKKKKRRSSIKAALTELIISEESNIRPEIKCRRSSTRLTLNSNEEPEPVPVKRRKKRVSICMPTNSVKNKSLEENIQRNLVKKTLDSNDLTEVKKYYLDKTVPNKITPLETIFEENQNSNKLIGKKKSKRLIPFSEINKQKERRNYHCQKQLTARKIKSVNEALKGLQDDSERD